MWDVFWFTCDPVTNHGPCFKVHPRRQTRNLTPRLFMHHFARAAPMDQCPGTCTVYRIFPNYFYYNAPCTRQRIRAPEVSKISFPVLAIIELLNDSGLPDDCRGILFFLISEIRSTIIDGRPIKSSRDFRFHHRPIVVTAAAKEQDSEEQPAYPSRWHLQADNSLQSAG